MNTQPAAARRSAEAELRTLIAKFAPAHLRLVGALRRSLRKRLPTAHELVHEYRTWFVISYSPTKLLRGSGNRVRSIDVDGASTLARPAVSRLIDEAIARNRVPFARTGRGPLVIRPASTRKHRRCT